MIGGSRPFHLLVVPGWGGITDTIMKRVPALSCVRHRSSRVISIVAVGSLLRAASMCRIMTGNLKSIERIPILRLTGFDEHRSTGCADSISRSGDDGPGLPLCGDRPGAACKSGICPELDHCSARKLYATSKKPAHMDREGNEKEIR